MLRNTLHARCRLAALGLLLFVLFQSSIARVVDPENTVDPILEGLAQELDIKGIDVRFGKATESAFTSSRPQLASLMNFPADSSFSERENRMFAQFFVAGLAGDTRLLAVRNPNESSTSDIEEFRRIWDAAPVEARLFLSFSGADIQYAKHVGEALRTRGYVVFVYKKAKSSSPITNAVEVGRFFAQAGSHFVIDSAEARRSDAVTHEALALQGRLANDGGIYNSDRIGFPLLDFRVGDPPCCQLCRFRQGTISSCGPVQCGPQCFGAMTRGAY